MRWLAFLLFAVSAFAENRIVNSSFEVKATRGWISFGNDDKFGNDGNTEGTLTNDSVHGTYSISMPSGTRIIGRGVWLTNGVYTYSCYMKGSAVAGPINFGVVGGFIGTTPNLSTNVNTSWVRYHRSFTVTSNAFYWPRWTTVQPIRLLIDAAQLEAGTNLTAYAPQAPIEQGITIPNTNSVWFSGDTPKFTLNFYNDGATASPWVGYDVYDVYNSNVLSGSLQASLPSNSLSSVNVNMPSRTGWFRIMSRLHATDNSHDEATTAVYPFQSNIVASATDWLGGHPHYSKYMIHRELLSARRLGRNLSPNSEGSRWQTVEPTRGNFVWKDIAITNQFYKGMTILQCLTPSDGIWPAWATNANGTADMMAWSNYCYQVVNRYKDFVTYWEAGPNEPHQSGPTNEVTPPILNTREESGTNYAMCLTYAVAGITNAHPTAKIIGMAGAHGNGDWAWRVWTNLTLATQTNIYAVSAHIYPQDQGLDGNLPENSDGHFTQPLGWVTRFGGLRPIWNTEPSHWSTGGHKGLNGMWSGSFDVQPLPGGAQEAARNERMSRQLQSIQYLVNSCLRDIGYGFSTYFYYQSKYFSDSNFEDSQPYTSDYLDVDKPEHVAVSIATHFVRAPGFGRITNAIGKQLEMYGFTNAAGNAVVAAWNYDRTNRIVILTNAAFALYDCMGQQLQTNNATIRVHRLPQYLVSGTLTTLQLSNSLRFATVYGTNDVIPPLLSVDVAPSGTWPGGDALLKWTALDDKWATWTTAASATNVLYAWKMDNDAFTSYNQTNHIWYNGLAAGNHTFTVRAKDADSNVGEISYVFEPQAIQGGASGNIATTATIGTLIVTPPP